MDRQARRYEGAALRAWRQHLAMTMVAIVALSACTQTSEPGTGDGRDADEETAAPEAPPNVKPNKVRSSLRPKQVMRCMRDKVPIEQLAGRYFGPIGMITGQVQENRDLTFSAPAIDFLEKKDFSRVLEENRARLSRKQRRANDLLEWSLGFRPLGSDGSAAPPGEVADLVAGLYIPRNKKVVVQQHGELDDEYVVLAHELGHAAVDEAFGIGARRSPFVIDDEDLALSAVVEGDASLVELRVASQFAEKKAVRKGIKQLLSSRSFLKRNTKDGMPHSIADQMIFPYRWGLAFACTVFKARGWKGINKLYRKQPASTAEIMFPERHMKGEEPGSPAKLSQPGGPWRRLKRGTIGPAHLKALFEAPGDHSSISLSKPLARAAAWNGGTYEVWDKRGNRLDGILGISLVEHPDHKGVLCASMLQWAEARATRNTVSEVIAQHTVEFSSNVRTSIVSCDDNEVRFVIAPEREEARNVLGL